MRRLREKARDFWKRVATEVADERAYIQGKGVDPIEPYSEVRENRKVLVALTASTRSPEASLQDWYYLATEAHKRFEGPGISQIKNLWTPDEVGKVAAALLRLTKSAKPGEYPRWKLPSPNQRIVDVFVEAQLAIGPDARREHMRRDEELRLDRERWERITKWEVRDGYLRNLGATVAGLGKEVVPVLLKHLSQPDLDRNEAMAIVVALGILRASESAEPVREVLSRPYSDTGDCYMNGLHKAVKETLDRLNNQC